MLTWYGRCFCFGVYCNFHMPLSLKVNTVHLVELVAMYFRSLSACVLVWWLFFVVLCLTPVSFLYTPKTLVLLPIGSSRWKQPMGIVRLVCKCSAFVSHVFHQRICSASCMLYAGFLLGLPFNPVHIGELLPKMSVIFTILQDMFNRQNYFYSFI
jgi:hypothetical protein